MPVPVALVVLACSNGEVVSGQTPPAGLVPQEIAGRTLYVRPGFHEPALDTAERFERHVLQDPGAHHRTGGAMAGGGASLTENGTSTSDTPSNSQTAQ